ncbi:MAG: YjfB family protein [Oscillospiraceae bacterium]|nr:YjfB family protein [Oscillospiraceae bacterium]
MEMEVAAMSMAMANSNLQNSLSVSMLKKSMEAVEDTMEGFIDMMNNIPSPDGRGQLLNVRV